MLNQEGDDLFLPLNNQKLVVDNNEDKSGFSSMVESKREADFIAS